jgi:chromosome segregation ATPase
MFLSRLRLEGFKSYSQPVEVDFSPQIAVIIGSNGVGKSNALEAIVWALGESDHTTLRCMSQEDLLYAGPLREAAAPEARVELVFEDNGKESSVVRSLKRNGDQEFAVNGFRTGNIDQHRQAISELGAGFVRHNVIRQEELTDFFVKSMPEREKYLERYVGASGALPEVNSVFQEYLRALIPESSARIIWDAGTNNVDVEVTFPDKGSRRGVSLSGGERAVTALALKLALFGCSPSPTYLLDEVEPSLDWTHNRSVQELLKKLAKTRQLIMVTHFESTIRLANTVHGVRVRRDGSSWLKFHFVMDERLLKAYKCC